MLLNSAASLCLSLSPPPPSISISPPDAFHPAGGGVACGAGWGSSVREAAGGEGEGGGLVHGMEG